MEVCQGNMLKVCHFTSVHDAKDRRIFSKECCSLAKLGFKVFIDVYKRQGLSIRAFR